MKRIICLLTALVLVLCGCTQKETLNKNTITTKREPPNNNKIVFTKNKDGIIVSDSGIEYSFLANEGILYYLGDLEFEGSVQRNDIPQEQLNSSYQSGAFSIKNDENKNILIVTSSDSEWYSIYRKTTLPTLDFSADNCTRIEFLPEKDAVKNTVHTTCGDGITNKSQIAEFFSDVQKQKSPHEAGLYDLVKKPDDTLENCYLCGIIYGFFEEEPNLAIGMHVTSYNNLAYSVSLGKDEYVLPESWCQKLLNK